MDTKKVRYYVIISLIILNILFVGYYTNRYRRTLDYNVSKSKITSFDNILYMYKEENEQVVIFYKYSFQDGEDGLGVSIFKNTDGEWRTRRDAVEKMNMSITSTFLYISDGKTIECGYINDPSIDSIKIVYPNGSEFANIINTDWKRLWMHEIKGKEYKKQIYDKSGNLL